MKTNNDNLKSLRELRNWMLMFIGAAVSILVIFGLIYWMIYQMVGAFSAEGRHIGLVIAILIIMFETFIIVNQYFAYSRGVKTGLDHAADHRVKVAHVSGVAQQSAARPMDQRAWEFQQLTSGEGGDFPEFSQRVPQPWGDPQIEVVKPADETIIEG